VIPTQRKPVERLLLQFERQPRALIKEQIIIQQDERNHWTSQYTTLTRDFYLKME
jgi:tRNA1(Val) A37 N6-methylase TrmN6